MFVANLTAYIKNAEKDMIGMNKYKKTFKTFYTDTTPKHPEGFDSSYAKYAENAYLFRDIKEDGEVVVKRTHKPNQQKCCICLEEKSSSTIYFCRCCDAKLCGTCYNASKKGHPAYMAWGLTPHFNSTELHQPKCPCCKGEGVFGVKGHKAPKLKSIPYTIYDGNVRQILVGQDVYEDDTLKGLVATYINENNSFIKEETTKIVKYIEEMEVIKKTIETDDRLMKIVDEVSILKERIEEWRELIWSADRSIQLLRQDGEKIVDEIAEIKPLITSLPEKYKVYNAFDNPRLEYDEKLYMGNFHEIRNNFIFHNWNMNDGGMIIAELRDRHNELSRGLVKPINKDNTIQDIKNKVSIMTEEEKKEMLAFLTAE